MQTETNPVTSTKSPVTNVHNKRFTAPTKERLGKREISSQIRENPHTPWHLLSTTGLIFISPVMLARETSTRFCSMVDEVPKVEILS